MFHLRRGKGFRKCVGYHLVGRAVDDTNLSFFDDPSNKMEMNVDMFCMRVILVLLHERNRRLIVGE